MPRKLMKNIRLSIHELTAIVQALSHLKWSNQMICEVFLRKLEAQLKAYTIPQVDWFRILVLLFSNDINAQDWVRANIAEADPLPSWQEAKIILTSHFETADYYELLKQQYLSCHQTTGETAQMYGDRFRYLCDQLGYSDNNEVVINHFLSRLQPKLYAEFLEFKADMQMQHDNWLVISLHDAVKICIKLDVKSRTIQQAMSSSSSSSSSTGSGGISSSAWTQSKRARLFCRWHPNSNSHTTAECRYRNGNPGRLGTTSGAGPFSPSRSAAVHRLTQELSHTNGFRRPPGQWHGPQPSRSAFGSGRFASTPQPHDVRPKFSATTPPKGTLKVGFGGGGLVRRSGWWLRTSTVVLRYSIDIYP